MNFDRWSSHVYREPHVDPYMLSHVSLFVNNWLQHSRYFYTCGSMAMHDVFDYMSKYAGGVFLCLASTSNSNSDHHFPGNTFGPNTRNCKSYKGANHIATARHNLLILGRTLRLKGKSVVPVIREFTNIGLRKICKPPKQLQSIPMLSLAAALVSLIDKVSIRSVQMKEDNTLACVDQRPCEVEHQGCNGLCFTGKFSYSRHAVEPRTGIEFPTVLDNSLAQETNSNWLPEVLVATGSKTMKIVKIKSLKVYAFGFYVHPNDVCKKLGPKYASITAGELNRHHSFYQDLLREDISMTVRLVVRVNGLKISTVKNEFEKSLRARLMKTNPDTDFDCLRRFSSLFSQDTPIRAGTTIFFRRTADGQLITEIGGRQIGAVHSRDLCRAFFDMYIGEVPVSEETKYEIGKNVATMLGQC